MESINGIEFFDVLSMLNGTFKPEMVAFYGANIVLMLEYLHNLDIIYRDLKLENIMIDDEVNLLKKLF
jgi:serine/threonine protein kinase